MSTTIWKRLLASLAGLFTVLLTVACTSEVAEDGGVNRDPDPLIPLRTLFSPGSYDAPQISPDGKLFAYFGPLDGASNLWVAPVDDPEAARPLTREVGRGLQSRDVSGNVMYRWSLDSRRVLYPQDTEGDENWNLYVVDVANGERRNLTQLESGRVELLGLSEEHPDQVLISISASLVAPPDLYHLDLESGERTLVQEAGGFIGFLTDNALRPRIALAFNAEGGIDLLRSSGNGEWRPAFALGIDDLPALSATGYQKIARFDSENRRAYFYDSRGRDTIALVSYELESGDFKVVAEDAKVDIGGVLYHPTSNQPQAVAVNWTRTSWQVLDEAVQADFDWLVAQTEGDIRVVSRAHDDRRWIVRFTMAHEPESYLLYERGDALDGGGERNLRKLFVTTPELEGLPLAKLHPVTIQSRDGLDLVSYLAYPPWLDRGDGRPTETVPLVMLVHGGPSDERAQYGYGPFLHWLANRGYGVFYVNFRGSPGFGKAFVNAQRMEWGGKMHEDLVDQVEWAISEGITERDQVAIVGGSYGGYAVLVGMTMTPNVFACGIDLVGPSNLEIFMPHWDVDSMSRVIGDPRTEQGRAFLRSRSPINFAAHAKNPILIGQGANDSRVPQDQSDTIVEVFKSNAVDVTYLLYPDEGHGLLRPANTFSFWAVSELFLADCLGGRSQPLTDELEGASVQVPVGVEHIPGLLEALERRSSLE